MYEGKHRRLDGEEGVLRQDVVGRGGVLWKWSEKRHMWIGYVVG